MSGTDHLEEIKDLSANAIEKAIELFPDYADCRPEEEVRKLVSGLLIDLHAIQQELRELQKEQSAR
jgi:hypothetical protein